jgi:hypothetical protein
MRSADIITRCPSSRAERKTFARTEFFSVCPVADAAIVHERQVGSAGTNRFAARLRKGLSDRPALFRAYVGASFINASAARPFGPYGLPSDSAISR